MKWCCIILNEFLPTDSMRRKFAVGGSDEETRKKSQLEKAREKLAALKRLAEKERTARP